MDANSLWPFFFEVNVLQYRARGERTLFVTIEEDGKTHWVDHSGRFTRIGGFGGTESDDSGNVVHTRGGRELSAEREQAEKCEFTIDAALTLAEFGPIRAVIDHVGKPWREGWENDDAQRLHELLEPVYWRHVNRFVHEPFDEHDSKRPKDWD